MPAQLRACRDYALAHGYTAREITDEGISGATLDRPGLETIRQLVRKGEVDVVLALDSSRISRELVHLLIVKEEIDKRARLEFVDAKFDDSANGRMMFSMKGVFSQYERELVKERTLRGRKEKARQGFIVGGRVPYGYDYRGKSEGQRGCFVIDEQQAPIVREMFAAYDQGASIREIVRRLRADGSPTWGDKPWGKSSVGRILKNETYAGTAHYGTHKREGNRLVVRTDAQRISLTVPPIVERGMWERVQARLADNPKVGRPTTRYLLRGLLHCSCGRRMGGDPGHGSPCYRCAGRDTLSLTAHKCQSRILALRLDRAVWDAVIEPFQDSDKLKQLVSHHIKQLTSSDGNQRTAQLKKQIALLKGREDRAVSGMLDFPDAHDQFKAAYQKSRDERRRLEVELSERERQERMSGTALDSIESIVSEISGVIPTLDLGQRQEFLRRVTEKVTWDGTEAEIVCFIAQKWPDHQHVMRSTGGHLQGPFRAGLAAHIAEIGDGSRGASAVRSSRGEGGLKTIRLI